MMVYIVSAVTEFNKGEDVYSASLPVLHPFGVGTYMNCAISGCCGVYSTAGSRNPSRIAGCADVIAFAMCLLPMSRIKSRAWAYTKSTVHLRSFALKCEV